VSVKSAVLAAATLGVVVLAVYLFVQVRATPARAGSTHVAARPTPPSHAPEPTQTPPSSDAPAAPPSPGTKPNARVPRIGTEVDGPPPPTAIDDGKVNVKLDNMMEQANKAYDTQDFDNAIAIAGKVLAKEPNNVRMLRIMVSANCIQGDSVIAQQHYERLPKFDREQMRSRCDRYGVTFKEPPE
jgi:hypothetical protein